MLSVKFLDFRKLYTAYPELDGVIKRCLVNGKLILQEDVESFERRFAEYCGKKYAVGLNSGTDALLLALVAAGVGPGDEVITVSHTFVATIQVIHHLGAKPVLVDVGEDGLMDRQKVAGAIGRNTKAIIPVHLSGDYVDSFAAVTPGINIIEDAAQAIGAKGVGYGGVQCWSFYPAKILGAFGDAGAITTDSQIVADRIRSLRNHGGVTKYNQERYEYGWNSRLDNIWAAVLNVKMDYLDVDLKKREAIAHKYLKELEGVVELPVDREGRVWQDFVVRVDHSMEFANRMIENGVETLGAGALANHRHTGLGLKNFDLPNTDDWVERSVRLPCNQFMTPEEVDYVIKAVKQSV